MTASKFGVLLGILPFAWTLAAHAPPSISTGQPEAPPLSVSSEESAILKTCQINVNETDPKKIDAGINCLRRQNKQLSKFLMAREKLAITTSRLLSMNANLQSLQSKITSAGSGAPATPSQKPNLYCRPDTDDEAKYIRVRRTLLGPMTCTR